MRIVEENRLIAEEAEARIIAAEEAVKANRFKSRAETVSITPSEGHD